MLRTVRFVEYSIIHTHVRDLNVIIDYEEKIIEYADGDYEELFIIDVPIFEVYDCHFIDVVKEYE